MLATEQYIDFHTHKPSKNKNVFEISSIHFNETIQTVFFTIGKHPWWTKTTLTSDEKQEFIITAKQKNCIGIGEIGLDKLNGEPMEIQLNIFRELLTIAEDLKKPVIIHCVRSFDKLISIKKEFPKIEKWCIHGFSRHKELASQLIKNGFYISVAPTEKITLKYKELIKSIPSDKLFLETDDSDIEIEKIYLQTAKIKGISIQELKLQMIKNLEDFIK